MNYNRKTLTDKIVLELFNNSNHPMYYIGRTRVDNKTFNIFECRNPFAKQLIVKDNFNNVETRAYYPHQLYVRTR